MLKKKYLPRVVDKEIEELMEIMGAVLIEGCKWCGKSTTGLHHAKSVIEFQNPDKKQEYDEIKNTKPSLFLNGEKPKMFDEWQMYPIVWDTVRYNVDKTGTKGQYILTGSATPNHKGILHSGAGRIAKLRMRPMSLYESGASTGDISLKDICNNNIKEKLTGEVDLKKIIDLIIRGGFPSNIDTPLENASLMPTEYLNAIIDDDAFRIDGIKRDTTKMKLLLRSLARNESTTVTNKKLKNDIKEKDNEDIDVDTVASYLDIFERLFIIDNQKPFFPKMRSSVKVKQAEKRHFVDPSLACSLLKGTKDKLLNDLNTLGFLFESLCERDLKIYAESFNANLYHYQDYNNKEIDAVIELEDDQWCAFEIKLGANQIDEAANNLLKIKEQFKENGPKVLCVICGLSNAIYKRPDGVIVVPITSLKN